jgi:hypothetical protein
MSDPTITRVAAKKRIEGVPATESEDHPNLSF